MGIDAKDGWVALRGWVTTAELTAAELALQMKEAGVTTVIYTDVSRDGMMQGPNVPATRALIAQTGMEVIGSGGGEQPAGYRCAAGGGLCGSDPGQGAV